MNASDVANDVEAALEKFSKPNYKPQFKQTQNI